MKITIVLLCLSLSAFAQKTKSFQVTRLLNGVSITGKIRYDETNSPMDTLYYIMGKNQKYQAIIDIITVYRGHLLGLKKFLSRCLEAFNEEDGVTLTYEDHKIRTDKVMGIKGLTLYGIDDDSNDYVYLNKAQVTKLLNKLN